MKYIVVDRPKGDRSGDWFCDEFATKEEAVKHADFAWSALVKSEKKRREIIIIDSVNEDEDAWDHLEGDIVCKFE